MPIVREAVGISHDDAFAASAESAVKTAHAVTTSVREPMRTPS
jgi:hypothetical protein